MSLKKRGLLIANLGTPDSTDPESIARFLRAFLMDPRVVDIPWLFRWVLVNILIIPKRKFLTAHAYQQIWTKRGSPLGIHLMDLEAAVKNASPAADSFLVVAAFRNGKPSVADAFEKFKAAGVDEVVVFPLFPQYAESTTESLRDECDRQVHATGLKARLVWIEDYFSDPGFIESFAGETALQFREKKSEHLVLSFHGLPERHLTKLSQEKGDGQCLKSSGCCDRIHAGNRLCYRAQCFATARAIVERLGLSSDQWSVSFQSRLGRNRWIEPSTDETLRRLREKGIRRVLVACPSFAADGLETLEEIGIRARKTFLDLGGEDLSLVSCPNASPLWANSILKIVGQLDAGAGAVPV